VPARRFASDAHETRWWSDAARCALPSGIEYPRALDGLDADVENLYVSAPAHVVLPRGQPLGRTLTIVSANASVYVPVEITDGEETAWHITTPYGNATFRMIKTPAQPIAHPPTSADVVAFAAHAPRDVLTIEALVRERDEKDASATVVWCSDPRRAIVSSAAVREQRTIEAINAAGFDAHPHARAHVEIGYRALCSTTSLRRQS